MKKPKKNWRAAIGVAFALAMMPVCARAQSVPSNMPAPVAAASVGQAPMPPKGLTIKMFPAPESIVPPVPRSTAAADTSDAQMRSAVFVAPVKSSTDWASPENIIPFGRDVLEGGGAWYWPDPSRYGIKACPENHITIDQLRVMTPDGAYWKLKELVWDRLHIGDLPPEMRLPVFSAGLHMGAGNHGRGPVQDMIAESGNDPHRFVDLYADRLHSLHNYIPDGDVRIDQIKAVMDYRGDRSITEIARANPVSGHHLFARFWHRRHTPADTQLAAADTTPTTPVASDSDSGTKGLTHPLRWLAGLGAGLMLVSVANGAQAKPRRAPPVPQPASVPGNRRPPFPPASPFSSPQSGFALQPQTPANGALPVSDSNELSAEEYAAMMAVYGGYNPVRRENYWHVPRSAKSHIFIQKGRLHLSGAEGMEEALIYAAKAWGNQCSVSGASPQMLAHMQDIAQKLVAQGKLDRDFTVKLAGSTQPDATSLPQPAPRRPLPRPGQNSFKPRRPTPAPGGAVYA